MDFVEIEAPIRGARHAEMSAMDGIERTAKERDAARMMFRGGAVRLRYRQCASQTISIFDFLMNCRLQQHDGRKGQPQRLRTGFRHRKPNPMRREESCPVHRRWSGPVLLRPPRPPRRWNEIQSDAPCSTREEFRDE